MKLLRRIAEIWWLLTLAGCGLYTAGTDTHEYSFDGMKKISPDIKNAADSSCWGQATYRIKPSQRLLMRFESFKKHISDVKISGGRLVKVQIAVASASARDDARSSLILCPLTKNWMMRATWEFSHPYGEGRWENPGGDYEGSLCVRPELPPKNTDDKTLLFDVTRWFIDYARGRDVNYGFVLKSTGDTEIVGEKSGSFSPRMLFEKYR